MCLTVYINNVSSSSPRQRAFNIATAQQKLSIFNVTGKARGKVSGGREQMEYSLFRKDLHWLECMFHLLPYQVFLGWHIVYLTRTANDNFSTYFAETDQCHYIITDELQPRLLMQCWLMYKSIITTPELRVYVSETKCCWYIRQTHVFNCIPYLFKTIKGSAEQKCFSLNFSETISGMWYLWEVLLFVLIQNCNQ